VVGEGVMDRLPAERPVELLVRVLGERRGHAVGGVQARKRRNRIHAALGAFGESLPPDLRQVADLYVEPGRTVLRDVGQVLPARALPEYLNQSPRG
jgi:hypothetical protein